MSIPERLWRVVAGHYHLAQERIAAVDAEASAYQELADALRSAPSPGVLPDESTPGLLPPPVEPTAAGHDPLEACYVLLQVQPGAPVAELEDAYEARLAEIRPDAHPPGSPERAALEARRSAVNAAYERLRDALNPTETRFERLEF